MRIPLDRESTVPLYRQIQDYLRTEIRSGALPADTRLPASRDLAVGLGVNRLTVTNAYDSLESEGLVYSRQGSGTYVTPALQTPKQGDTSTVDWPLWQQELLSRTWLPAQFELDQMSAALARPGVISFAAGLGDSSLFPVEDFRRAVQDILRHHGREALGYGDRAGYPPLRATIARILAAQGTPALPERILVTSGSQQGLSLIARLLLHSGDVVVVESPTYAGAIDLFRSLDVRLAGIPVDDEGMQVERLEDVLRDTRARLIYTMPTFHNPTGTCLTAGRRQRLMDLAVRYNVPLLEDEFVADLRYEGHAEPSLAALDPGGHVIYMGTFSKMLMPGLRLGYLLAAGPIYERLLAAKRVDDISTSSLIQRALERYITVGRYQTHLRRANQLYRSRRDAMADALQRCMPDGVLWRVPEGGLFIWLRLPGGLTSRDLVPVAADEGVSFAPGSLYFAGGRAQPYVRLNFVEFPPDIIVEGIRRLGQAIRRCMAEKAVAGPWAEMREDTQPAL